MTRTGRPSTAAHPTVVVRHGDTGEAVAWAEGGFTESSDLGSAAAKILAAGEPVRLGREVYLMTDGPHGATAAMLAACKGRGVIARGLEQLENGLEMGEQPVRGMASDV